MKIQTSDPRSLFIGACWLFPVGFVLLGLAAFFTWRTSSFIESSVTASGTVVALEPVSARDSNSNASTQYAPVFSFTADDGKTYSVTSNSSSNPPAFAVNDEVTVLYNPADPQHARINTFGQLWFVPVLLGGIGTLFLIIGSVFVFALRKLARRAPALGSPSPSDQPKS